MSTEHETADTLSLSDAFELVCLELVQLEAITHAANVAIDEYVPPPEEYRRSLNRAHALISTAADRAAMSIELIAELKSSLKAAHMDKRYRRTRAPTLRATRSATSA
jgi:hypothetical protein